ncbi:glyoxalase [Halobacillus fulvus]|nr:glyoxalase [Halobacillus fulvus]
MKLRLELFVQDIEESVRFYERVLGFVAPYGVNKEYTSITNGEVTLGLGKMVKLEETHPLKAGVQEAKGKGVEIVLQVEDLQATYERVRSTGYEIETELGDRPWGLADFRLIDPDGYYIRISS